MDAEGLKEARERCCEDLIHDPEMWKMDDEAALKKAKERLGEGVLLESEISKTPWLDEHGTKIASIVIGRGAVLYRTSKQRLLKIVPRFAAFLDHASKAYLPDISVEAFDLLMEYVNSDDMSIRPMTPMIPDNDLHCYGPPCPSWDPVMFFSLAEKFELPFLQNLIMDAIMDFHNTKKQYPSSELVYQAYQHTEEGSAISRYALQGFVYSLRLGDNLVNEEDAVQLLKYKPIATDVVRFLNNNKDMKDPRDQDFHTSVAPEVADLPTKQSSVKTVKSSSTQIEKKKRSTNHQESPAVKKQRVDKPSDNVPIANEEQTKQQHLEGKAVSTDDGINIPAIKYNLPAHISNLGGKVYNLLHSEEQMDEGLRATAIAQRLGASSYEVLVAGQMLLEAGCIYTTVDDETWAALKY
ncbi:hypothetical protein N431DRAFT_483555 [Stipitochalara longipes BDJ]|nr:hypothetical protein N431DRAFT_483555 [Stipitochalara longipes BDJ]